MGFLSQPLTLQSLFGKKRTIGPITVQVVLDENSADTLTITKQPVQQGAAITDHAYMEPIAFSCRILFQDDIGLSLSKLYQELLDLQSSRVPFDITTPKRIYHNMLISTLRQTTDKTTENILSIGLSCQEVIIVSVLTTQVPRRRQRHPGRSGATQNAGKKSALLSLKEGVGALFSK